MALKAEEAREFKDKARMMYFSNEVIDRFCATATPGQLAAAAAMLDDEQGVRERRKRDRLFRKAKFPQVKSFEGYDFSQVSFPEGYTAEDLMGLGFIDRAQDFVFYGQTGRGKTHLASPSALPPRAPARRSGSSPPRSSSWPLRWQTLQAP